ncbi:acyl carrier protein [uncultured Eubacterium sp.]|uniref:acyl carrier protein n=1 Tax=uncultured Eubacterium sp. TaxID=165185 RepID=UPI00260B873B|nr:acyl carrier protein [uncultured Eubacterium sp.]
MNENIEKYLVNELKKYMQLNSNITLNQNLFDIGLDSLSLISLIIDIENNYKFEFDDSDMVLEKFSTIESIIKLVDSYL